MKTLDHALNIAGFPRKAVSRLRRLWLLRPGAPIVFVSWDGCMAHIRNERGRGTIIGCCNNRDLFGRQAASIDLVRVLMEDGTERLAALDNLRIVNGSLEAWQ